MALKIVCSRFVVHSANTYSRRHLFSDSLSIQMQTILETLFQRRDQDYQNPFFVCLFVRNIVNT